MESIPANSQKSDMHARTCGTRQWFMQASRNIPRPLVNKSRAGSKKENAKIFGAVWELNW
jgi:hypothetical protein